MELSLERFSDDRRSAERLPVIVPLDATMNGKPVEIIDLSLGGARVRHEHGVVRGYVTLRFAWNRVRFKESVRLVSSRVIALSDSGTSYESRLAFSVVGEESATALEQAIRILYDQRMASWIANLEGEAAGEPHVTQPPDASPSFVVCTLSDGRWRRRRTSSRGHDPVNGFIVRSTVADGEIRRLCHAFAEADDDARQLLRMFAHHVS